MRGRRLAADLGQGEELDGVEEKALTTGATKATSRTCTRSSPGTSSTPCSGPTPCTKGRYLLGTSIARPLIAKAQVEIALKRAPRPCPTGPRARATTRCASSWPPGPGPGTQNRRPLARVGPHGPRRLVAYAEKHGIPVPVTKEKPYSSDRNLLHITFEGGILEDPWAEPPADMFVLTKSPGSGPG